jgi:hypothetical protein
VSWTFIFLSVSFSVACLRDCVLQTPLLVRRVIPEIKSLPGSVVVLYAVWIVNWLAWDSALAGLGGS